MKPCQEPFSIEGCHASHAGGCNGLSVSLVSNIAGGEDTRNTRCHRAGADADIAGRRQIEFALKERGRWIVADRDKHTIRGSIGDLASCSIPNADASDRGGVPDPTTSSMAEFHSTLICG